jgi:hypothetical protein
VLSGLVKRIADGATGVAIGSPDDIAVYRASVPIPKFAPPGGDL